MRLTTTASILSILVTTSLGAEDVYRVPPKDIVDLVDAPLTPVTALSPDNAIAAVFTVPPLVTIADLSQPELKLAGLRFNPVTLDQTRSAYYTAASLLDIATGKERAVPGLPSGARIRHPAWSPDGKKLAFTLSAPSGVELWVVDAATAAARRVTPTPLNAAFPSAPFVWSPDGASLVVRAVPGKRSGAPPREPAVPSGPVVQENLGKKAPARTYQDLLRSPYDADLFEYHLTAVVARVGLDGSSTVLGAPGLVVEAQPSPDGKYLHVETVHRPFSFLVPVERFPRRIDVWKADGTPVKTLVDLPLAEAVPIDFSAVPTGPREVDWRADAPATLAWVEALDGGDPKKEAAMRDRVFTLAAPFAGEPVALADLALRFEDVEWGDDGLALVHESWWKTRKTRTWRVVPGSPGKPELLFERSFEDRYADPGRPVTKRTPAGTSVLRIADKGKSIYLIGDGASPEGNRPFLDRFDVATKKTTRLFRSEAPSYEMPVRVLDDAGTHVVTRRESVAEPPNLVLRDLAGKTERVLTRFPNPTPQLASARKELIRYQRADGVKLTGTLYTPPGWKAGDAPLPVLMWAYPQEFKSADAAGQVTDSPYRFVRVDSGSPLFFLVRGFAVLDNPGFPIVGEAEKEPNDTYVTQLVADAKAAADELVKRGVADRSRLAIGGHSYGAFTTANLLAHSDVFRAGIARSGAYNRTLTPFGFQSEERTFWDAPSTYMEMSPFTHAKSIDRPLLMIHGMEDANSGTFPIQSERLYAALKGLGKTSRLVLLPHESHGYRARESVLHMLWEMDEWLGKYVKGAPSLDVKTSGAR